MSGLAVFLLLSAGFAALALAMPRHQRDLFGTGLVQPIGLVLRICGGTLLVAGLVPAIAGSGASIGIVLWFGLAALAALTVALVLTCTTFWRRG